MSVEKSSRRLMFEERLSENPGDTFLRYGLALQCLREGDVAEGRARLSALIADHPDDQIAAYQQLGQSYLGSDEPAEAARWLSLGVSKARSRGESHAVAEMEGMLAQLG